MGVTHATKDARKLMRRGTRACRECRRRKIRCIYDDGKTDVCQECVLHQRECIKQGIVRGGKDNDDRASNMKVQVTRLESAVEKLAREKKAGSRNRRFSFSDPLDKDAADLAYVDDQLKKRSPIYSLFDNEIIVPDAATPAHGPDMSNQILFLDPSLTDKEKLLSTIDHIPNVLQVLDQAAEWWVSWREQHFALRKAAASLSLRDFVQQKLSHDKVTEVALGMLAIAMALSHLRPGIDDLLITLPIPATQIVGHILAAVDQIVCDSETYVKDVEIVILLMMRAKHHTENNQLRKAWLRIRQGIRCAQAIGFGVANPSNLVMSEEEAESQRFIASIFEVDHLISMVLGFPYAKDPAFTDARAFSILLNATIQDEDLKMRALRRVITVAAGTINDRNAAGDIDDEITESTQATLDLAANCMPQGWWSLLMQPLSGLAQHRYESLLVQTWYWVVQSYLHMPYVIKPNSSPTAQRYRHLGLEGARNLIRTFNYLRTEPAISVYLCNCDDFQALLGACILLVGVLQNLSEELSGTSDSGGANTYISTGQANIEADLALVEDLKDIFRYRMCGQGGGISKQGLAVLEELTSLLYEDEENKATNTSFQGDVMGFNIDLSKRQKTIMLPYFGTIKIELTRKLPKRRPQEFPNHIVLTPPRSIDGSGSEVSPDVYQSPDLLSAYPYSQMVNPQSIPQYDMIFASDATGFGANNKMAPFIGMGFADQTSENAEIAPIAWDQWENYMFDQELDQDWNPGLQWNNSSLLYQ